MNKFNKVSGVMAAVMLVGSVSMADSYRGRGDSRDRGSSSNYRSGPDRGYVHSERSGKYGHSERSSKYGHCDRRPPAPAEYRKCDSGTGLAVGLLGLAVVAAVFASASEPAPVYAQPQVVYTAPQPVVVSAPQTVVYEVPQPLSMTINVQNSNDSMTPVVLRQVGTQWVGPKGEYYDNLPTVGQLRPIYGF